MGNRPLFTPSLSRSGKMVCIHNIGKILEKNQNYPEALIRYEEALQIAEQLGELQAKANILNNIAYLYYKQENYKKALMLLEDVLEIYSEMGLEDSSGAQNIKNGINIIMSKLS